MISLVIYAMAGMGFVKNMTIIFAQMAPMLKNVKAINIENIREKSITKTKKFSRQKKAAARPGAWPCHLEEAC